MMCNTAQTLLDEVKKQNANKIATKGIINRIKGLNISIRNLSKMYNEMYEDKIVFSTFYYKLKNYSFSCLEYKRINDILNMYEVQLKQQK